MSQQTKTETDGGVALRVLQHSPKSAGPTRVRVGTVLESLLDEQPEPGSDISSHAESDTARGVPGARAEQTEAPTERPRRIRGNRSVDSLFRNAYRAQLDMLALAATKANIMISLNGLLMSMLIISGTHFIRIDGLYIIPIGLLLVTCALATVFAVLAARPDISRRQRTVEEFDRDEAHLLVFEEFSDLQEPEYVGAMTTMLCDRQRVYRNMIAHVHELGSTADRKYRQLYYSYTVFMSGIVLTVLAVLAVEAIKRIGHIPLS